MSSMPARVIFDSPGGGAWNMAVDQALLMSAEQDGIVTLRLYAWDQPTLSLGYFQKYDDRQLHAASVACPVVRRRSGGGAILHDQELTYSLSSPSSHRWSKETSELYDLVHRVVVELLAEDGIKSQLFKDATGLQSEVGGDLEVVIDPTAFLCFQRRSDGDLVSGKVKVLGSAQRRLKHSLLQHGSLLFQKSKFAPELPGLMELSGKRMQLVDFSQRLSEALGRALGFEFLPAKLTTKEMASAEEIEKSTFGSGGWTRKR